jgi:alpha-mannosidase
MLVAPNWSDLQLRPEVRLSVFRPTRHFRHKWKLIVVSHTHWDREWYLPFQRFRSQLVEAVDSLLEIMAANPEFRYFTLDGQTIILEDYLEVRPSREQQLRELIEEGRILVGPWYVMPDEFLVSGESLVRNLLEGRRTASRFGEVMKVGYIPDPFGHIAQMPQILRGFGIDSAVLWRGVGSELRHNEALWESPDGSSVLLEYLPRGYANAAVLPSDPNVLMERLAHIRAELEPGATTTYLLLMNGDDHMFPQPEIPFILKQANRRLKDAELIHGTLPMMLAGVREAAEAQGVAWQTLRGELRSSERAHILAGVLSSRMNLKQRNYRCQILLERWAEPFTCFAGNLPTVPGDGRSGEVERMARDIPSLLRLAWRYLLMNQPHDSICGCSVDQVHQEMQNRYDWCEQVAEPIVARALGLLADSTDTESLLPKGDGAGALVVFNPESGPRTDFVEATAQLPAAWQDAILTGPDGHPVPYQLLRVHYSDLATATMSRPELHGYLRLAGPGREWPRWKLRILEKVVRTALRGRMPDLVVAAMDVVPGADPSTVEVEVEMTTGKEHNLAAISSGLRQISGLVDRGDARLFRFRVHRRDQVEVGFVAADVPAHGLKLYRFEPARPTPPPLHHNHEVATLENEFLSLQVSPQDGSLQLIDRETGAIYWGINSFLDGGDAGDEYTYSPPAEDLLVRGPAAPPALTVEEMGPARQRIRIDLVLQLPVGLAEDRRSRSQQTVSCPLTSRISVYPGIPRVDIQTNFTNLARDHRLRVHFPTQLQARFSHADGHFAVLRRPIEAPTGGPGWVEHPATAQPQLAFVDVNDGESGLLVANRGLPEYDVARLDSGPCIALTLLRCVGWLSRGDLTTRQGEAGPSIPTPGAQMQGCHTFEYSVIPHAGGWEQAMHQAHWFAKPLRAHWTGLHAGPLKAEMSFVAVSPSTLILSAVKRAEDNGADVVVRLYNPTEKDTEGTLTSFFALASAELTNLAEERGEDLPVVGGQTVHFPVGRYQVITIRLTPAR